MNEVTEQLGHADPRLTARTYAHVYRDAAKRRGIAIARGHPTRTAGSASHEGARLSGVGVARRPFVVTAADLFAGAGGLSRGLQLAGVRVVAAFECDDDAASTYEANHRTKVTRTRLDAATSLSSSLPEVPTILAGGPPCQGWSSLGHRGERDHRAALNEGVSIFVEHVRRLKPAAALFENVRGLAIADKGRRVAELLEQLREAGYRAEKTLVRASDHGVPQLRHRLFVIAIRRDLALDVRFPAKCGGRTPTVRDAIGDLPLLQAGGDAKAYACEPQTDLQRRLRGESTLLTWHGAPAHAAHLLALMAELPKDGGGRADLTEAVMPSSGFHNTYARLWYDRPAPAVTSAVGRVGSGRHVHPTQDRALTPREAARLQTFPDEYAFKGRGRWSVYRQIGNAVPPDLAAAIARPLVNDLAAALSLDRAA